MAGRTSIPQILWEDIQQQSALGWSTRKIADWLGEVHKTKVSHHAVADLLKTLRQQREEVSKSVVREKLSKSLTLDIDTLEREGARLRKVCKRLFQAFESQALGDEDDKLTGIAVVPIYLKAAEQLRKHVETKLKFAGADTPDDSLTALADAERRVIERLSRAASAREGSAPARDPADPEPSGEGGS